jgi:hypothetical protein
MVNAIPEAIFTDIDTTQKIPKYTTMVNGKLQRQMVQTCTRQAIGDMAGHITNMVQEGAVIMEDAVVGMVAEIGVGI